MLQRLTLEEERWGSRALARQLLARFGSQRAAQKMVQRSSGKEREWWQQLGNNLAMRQRWLQNAGRVGGGGVVAVSPPPPPPPPPPPLPPLIANADAFTVVEGN